MGYYNLTVNLSKSIKFYEVVVIRRQKLTIMAMALYVIAFVVSTHIPIPRIVYQAEVSDKWLHFLAYLILVFFIWFSVKPDNKPNWRKFPAWLVLVAACAYGGIDEIIQPYFGRTTDFYDFTSNCQGVLAGFIMFTFTSFWPSLLTVTAITIFSLTNLVHADLSKLVPVTDAFFNFLAYGSFALVCIKFLELYLPVKSIALRLFLALCVSILFMLVVKTGSLLLKRHFGYSDLLFGILGIITAVVLSYLTGFIHIRN
jgi:VanZ family protein